MLGTLSLFSKKYTSQTRGVTATRQEITKKGICPWHFQPALNLYLAFSVDGYSVGASIPPPPFSTCRDV